MILAADEIARSLSGAWDLLNRRAQGAARFDFGEQAFWRSFRAPLLVAPVLVIWLAAERAASGRLTPGASLFEDGHVLAQTGLHFAALWLTLPMLGLLFADKLRVRDRLTAFIIVCNWSSVLAAMMLAIPALLLAIEWATPALAAFFWLCAALLVMQMRWYATRVTLGLGAGVAGLLVVGDGLVGLGLLRLLV